MALLKSPRGHHQPEQHYSRATASLNRARSGHFRIDYAALHPRKRGPLPARNVRDGGQTRSSGGFRLTSAQVPQAEFQAAQCDVAAVPQPDLKNAIDNRSRTTDPLLIRVDTTTLHVFG